MLGDPGPVDGAHAFATGAGWHSWPPTLERQRVLFLWRVLCPVGTRMNGYLRWSRLGRCADLPIDMYRQWRHWCRFPRDFFNDPDMKPTTERFAYVRFPIVALNAVHDDWAPPVSHDAFLAGYCNAEVRNVTLDSSRAAL